MFMKYKILIVVVLFFYIYPLFFFFLPIPLDRVLQIVGFGCFLFTPKLRGIFVKSKYIHWYFIGLIINLFLIFIAQAFNYSIVDFYFFKLILNSFFNFFSAYLIIYLFTCLKDQSHDFIGELMIYLIIVYAIQALLSFILFVNPSFFDLYIGLLKQDNNENFMDRLGVVEKRLIGIGSAFFLGVIKYGIALYLLIVIPYIIEIKSKWLYGITLALITLAGIMTGRTFFIAIIFGILLFFLIRRNNVFKLVLKVLPIVVLSFLVISNMASFFLEDDRLSNISNYLFEIFINYNETGSVTTTSSDATKAMYIFPDNLKTWIIGDGRMLLPSGSYYMGSDVGYVRLIFYYGAICTFIYFAIQFFYIIMLMKLSKRRVLKLLFVMMFFWILVLNLKGIANIDQFLILFLLGLVYSNSSKLIIYDRKIR